MLPASQAADFATPSKHRGYSGLGSFFQPSSWTTRVCIPDHLHRLHGANIALDYKTPPHPLHQQPKQPVPVKSADIQARCQQDHRLPWLGQNTSRLMKIYAAGSDLSLTEGTLLGHESAKNQQLDDHYVGAIPTRVQEFAKDLEIESCPTGHSGQDSSSEVAVRISSNWLRSYEECNLANDHKPAADGHHETRS